MGEGSEIAQVVAVLLGGGSVATLTVIIKAVRDWREGKTAREDTAIERWQKFASRMENSANDAWSTVSEYRRWYLQLWAAYVTATGDRSTFPADPTTAVSTQFEKKGEQ